MCSSMSADCLLLSSKKFFIFDISLLTAGVVALFTPRVCSTYEPVRACSSLLAVRIRLISSMVSSFLASRNCLTLLTMIISWTFGELE